MSVDKINSRLILDPNSSAINGAEPAETVKCSRYKSLEQRQAEAKERIQNPYKRTSKVGRTWKRGGKVNYFSYHYRVRKARGRPKHCEDCGLNDPTKHYEWANVSGNYEDVNDYVRLCKPCHIKRDKAKPPRRHADGVPMGGVSS